MATRYVLNVDLADVFGERGRKGYLHTVAWGDEVLVVEAKRTHLEIEVTRLVEQDDGSMLPEKVAGFIEPKAALKLNAQDLIVPVKSSTVLKVNFVDVQQGDGAVIESPDGKVILVDGGDNQLFARYLAGRFRGTSEAKPKDIDCILVSHGDADHFVGLTKIHESEAHSAKHKRLFIQPHRVFHNGLVKRPEKKGSVTRKEVEMLGKTRKIGGDTVITGLESDLLKVADPEMNGPFLAWKAALKTYSKRHKIEFRRLEFGDDKAFDFFNDEDRELRISVLGPLMYEKGSVRGLKFLKDPPKGPRLGHESVSLEDHDAGSLSASHTINGHSIVFRLQYGGFSYLFSGDLNDEAGRFLARESSKGKLALKSEVFKVPHHGSADFSGAFFQAVSPIVSVVSSGDESARKEYIHPRATLMGALGKWSRVEEPLIFVTELVAFFSVAGWSRSTDDKKFKKEGAFFGFRRSAFGMVKTRTDGQRLLIYTDSGASVKKEAYAYALDDSGGPVPSPVLRV